MARTPISNDGWTLIATTSVRTLVSVEGGVVRIITGDTTGIPKEDGMPVDVDNPFIVNAGQSVSGWADGEGVVVAHIEV